VSDEQVLVVDRRLVPDEARWYGLRTDGLTDFLARVSTVSYYADRSAAEVDPTRKQLIPYLLLRDGARWFLMRRTRAGADARLHDRWSIGVGGHVNPGDGGLLGGLRREWQEELVTDAAPVFRPIALLNDDTTDVGAVHLGIVFVADAAGHRVDVRETNKLEGAFAEQAEIAQIRDQLETWSRIAFDELIAGSPVAGAML